MVRSHFLVIILFVCLAAAAGAETRPVSISSSGVTLEVCFERARAISETIGIGQANVQEAEAQYRQTIGAVLPHINWIKQQFYQDSGGEAGSGSPLQTQPLSYFQLTQPLFSGFRDWQALNIARSVSLQARLNQVQTDLTLLSNVANAFYTALSLANQLAVLQDTDRIIADRIAHLQHWVDLGRSRQSEVLSEQTQQATTEAQIEDTKRLLAEARHLLFFLTQISPDVPLSDDRPNPVPLSADEAVTRAGKRPDLMSAAEALHQADLNVTIAKEGHFPTLGLTADSYTERVGFLSDVRWDATFLLTVPLYAGGTTQAGIHVARAQEIIAQLNLLQLRRDIDRQVRSANDDLTYSLTEVQAYNKAVDLAMRNYKMQDKEYALGLISNLDLLQTLRDLQDTRRAAAIAQASVKLDHVLLRVAMGEML